MRRGWMLLAGAAMLAGCGVRHEPVKLIARPPSIEAPQAAVQPAPVLPIGAAASAAPQPVSLPPAAPQIARTPPPVALAPAARVHQPGDPSGNDAFRAAIEAKLQARAAAGR
jgi:hypothetical protein